MWIVRQLFKCREKREGSSCGLKLKEGYVSGQSDEV